MDGAHLDRDTIETLRAAYDSMQAAVTSDYVAATGPATVADVERALRVERWLKQ